MAHKKAGGSTRNGRNSNPQYRGVKAYGGTAVTAGSILIRQVGSSFLAGKNVGTGKDYTLFALQNGAVQFSSLGRGSRRKKFVHILPTGVPGT
ncbi:MAG: 50S ribosomal protein L27 [Proteobacteria bacterium]|nr:50S ribosomal protein L27 [Pseudomonadota bacterium]